MTDVYLAVKSSVLTRKQANPHIVPERKGMACLRTINKRPGNIGWSRNAIIKIKIGWLGTNQVKAKNWVGRNRKKTFLVLPASP